MFGNQGVGDFFHIAVHHEVELVQGEVDAVVGNAALRVVVGAGAAGRPCVAWRDGACLLAPETPPAAVVWPPTEPGTAETVATGTSALVPAGGAVVGVVVVGELPTPPLSAAGFPLWLPVQGWQCRPG